MSRNPKPRHSYNHGGNSPRRREDFAVHRATAGHPFRNPLDIS